MNENQRERENHSFDQLERGLRAGYANGRASVLAVLERRTGSSLRIRLPDAQAPDRPLVKPVRGARAGSRYEILGEVARGGLGVVMEGLDVDLGRSVAIKVLHERFHDDREVIERFVEEAQIGGQLQHPGIVPVYELGLQADDRPFFAMKLIRGDTLAQLLRKRAAAPAHDARLVDVFLRICQTVAYAHSRRVIHRDLKPSNVLVGRFGEVQVLDWGLAKVLKRGGVADERGARSRDASRIETVRSGEGSTASIAGSVMGTPAYMPPEQARGEIERLDERTDVFALGAILCEILTGRPLYDLDDPGEALRAAADAHQGPALERLEASGADPELAALVRSCIAPEPAARPSDAGVVAARVEAHVAATSERAREAQLRAALLKVRARSTAVIAAVVLAAVVAGGGALYGSLRGRWERQRATTARAVPALAEAERLAGRAEEAGLAGAVLFGRALGAARSAGEIVAAGEAPPELSARIQERIEELERREAQTRASALREASHGLWLERLREVRIGPDVVHFDFREGPRRREREAKRRAVEYAALFAELGLDAGSLAAEAVLSQLDCAHRQDFARALDAWAEAERIQGSFEEAADPESWRRLVRVARRLDPDHAWRNALRDELVRVELDAAALAALARPDVTGQLAPEELAVLISLLDAAGELEAAVGVASEGARRHPQDFWMQTNLYTLLSSEELLSARHQNEAYRAISAAVSLRPKSRVARFALALVALYEEGSDAEELMAELVTEDPENPVLTTWSFMLAMSGGRFDEAADMLPGVLDDLRATDCAFDYHNFLLMHGHGDWLLEPGLAPQQRAYLSFGLERYEEAFAALEELRAAPREGRDLWYVQALPGYRQASSAGELRDLHLRLLACADASEADLEALPGEELLAAAEALAFAWRDLPAATRLHSCAFEADPALKERLRFVRARTEAGCFAALASADASPGSRGLAASERAELRELARGWLHEELDAIEAELAAAPLSPESAMRLSQTLNGLQVYGWPAPIREERFLSQLEPEEATRCRFLWARLKGVMQMFGLMLDA